MAFPLMALGAGLGIAADDINKQRAQQAQLRMQQMKYAAELAQLRMALQQNQQKNQNAQDLAALSLPGGFGASGTGAGGDTGMASAPGANNSPYVGSAGGFNLSTAGAPQGAASPTFGSNAFEPMTAMPAPSGGGGNWETQHNNFAGMRIPGVVAGPNAGGFQSFATPEAGIQGISRQLDRYASGATTGTPLTTLRQIVSTWAPPNENPTDQLIARASRVMGVPPDQPLDLANPQVKGKLVEAMIRGEQGGRLPIDPGVIQRALGGGVAQPETQVAQAGPQTATDAGPQMAMPTPPNFGQILREKQAQAAALGHQVSPVAIAAAATQEFNRQRQAFTEQMQIYSSARSDATQRRMAAAQEGQTAARGLRFITMPDGSIKEWHPGQPIPPGARIGESGGAAAGGKASAFGSKEDLMQRWRQDFIAKNNREPTTDEIAAQRVTLGQATKPPGRQLAQMTQRLMIGANEVNRAVSAIAKLPAGTTLGWFGGAQAAMGENLGENIRKTLANAVTPQNAQILKALSNGVSRGLAILESGGSAQGLVGLSKQLQNDLPAENDTGLTIAAKFADIRQIVEAATEVLSANPDLGKEQKELLSKIGEDVKRAVPFTTAEVASVASNPSDENIAQFARRMGIGGGPQTGAVEDGYRFKGGDAGDPANWEKVQ